MSKIKFILVVPFSKVTTKGTTKIIDNINYNLLEEYAIKTPSKSNSLFGSSARFPPKNRAIDKTYRLFDASGLVSSYKISRYRRGKNTVKAAELKQRLDIKGGAIMFSGTANNTSDLDLIKSTLVLQNLENIKIYDISTAKIAPVTEL